MTLRASVWPPWCTRPTPGSSASRCPRRSWSSSKISPAPSGRSCRERSIAYTSDGVQLYGLKYTAPDLNAYEVVGGLYTKEPYAIAMRKGDHAF